MAISIIETRNSRGGTEGEDPTRDLEYLVIGTTDENEAILAILAHAPLTYLGLVQNDLDIKPHPDATDVWKIKIPYKKYKSKSPTSREIGSIKIKIDISGGNQNITQSLSTINKYKSEQNSLSIRDFKGAVNVGEDGKAAGTEIIVPAFSFTIDYVSGNPCTTAYIAQNYNLVGRFNGDQFVIDDGKHFLDLDPGQVLYLGFTSQERDSESLSQSFKYIVSPNKDDIIIGDVNDGDPITKYGWDFLWIAYHKIAESGSNPSIPWEVFIERLYSPGNLMGVLPV